MFAIRKKRPALTIDPYKLLQVLSLTGLEKTPVLQAFQRTVSNVETPAPFKQLNLLDL